VILLASSQRDFLFLLGLFSILLAQQWLTRQLVLFPVDFTGKFTPFGFILGENHKKLPQTAQNHVKINNFPKNSAELR